MKIIAVVLSSILSLSIVSCSPNSNEENTQGTSLVNANTSQTNSLDSKVIGTWNIEAPSGTEGLFTCVQKYSSDKSFYQKMNSSAGGEHSSTTTGVWRIENKKLFISPINEAGKLEQDGGIFDIVQIGENSMTLKREEQLVILSRAR